MFTAVPRRRRPRRAAARRETPFARARVSTSISASLWLTRRRTMSRPRPVPLPTGLVVKNGSNRRSRISAGMPGPLSTTRTTTRCRSQLAVTSTRPRLGNGIERVVDQIRPDLIELADEAAHARQVGFDVDGDGDRFRPRLGLEHGDGVAQARRQVHRLGHRGLIHVRESLDRRDQAGDPHRGLLNLRGDPANRASGRRPAEDRVERRSADRRGNPVERLDRHGGFGQRPGDRGVDAVIREPVGDGVLAFGLLDRRQHAVHARGEAGRAQRIDGRELGIGQPRRRPARASPARRPPGGPRAARRCVRSRRPGCSARAPVRPTACRARPSSRRAGRST